MFCFVYTCFRGPLVFSPQMAAVLLPDPDLYSGLVNHFNAKVAELKGLSLLKNIDDQSATAAKLMELDRLLSSAEAQMATLHCAFDQDMAAMDQAKLLMECMHQQQGYINTMQANLPQRLPGYQTEAIQSPKVVPLQDTAKSPHGKRPHAVLVKRIAYVTIDELGAAPAYITSRLTIDKINAVVDEMVAPSALRQG